MGPMESLKSAFCLICGAIPKEEPIKKQALDLPQSLISFSFSAKASLDNVFPSGVKMQNHKDRYGAIRREHREAERAVAQTIVVPTTSEAEMTVPADVEEVTGND